MPVTEWLTIREAAERFNVPASTVRWHCRESQGLLYGRAQKVGNTYTIRATDARDLADLLHRRQDLAQRKLRRARDR